MRRMLGKCMFMLAAMLCLAGCGREDDDSTPARQQMASARINAAGEECLYINEFIPLQFDDPEAAFTEKNFFYDTYGSRLYVLWAYIGEESATENLFLYVFDGETKKLERQPFALQIPDRKSCYIQSMDVREGERLSFRLKDSEGDFLVITDIEGNELSRQVPFPEQEAYPWNADFMHRYENKAFDAGDGLVVLGRCRDQENVTELFLYDTENGEETPLTVFDGELVRTLCMDGADTMYYTTLQGLNRWDKAGNTRTVILNLHENGISASPASNNLLMNSQGELLICELEGATPCVLVLSGEERRREDEIRITYFSGMGDSDLARPAQIFFQSHPELELIQERCENEADRTVIRDRVFMELAAGRGPELMWVLQEDMYELYEKGLLMDLSELIPDDIQEQILPGVIRSGTLDDKLVGIKLYALYDTILVSDALWEGESWTLEDVIGIMESREDWDFTFSYFLEDMDLYELLSRVLLPELDGSRFLNIEQGYCDFDSPEFIRLLEICKKYGPANHIGRDRGAQARQLQDGDGIGEVMCFVEGLSSFSGWMNRYNDSAHIVGFPTEEGSKNYITADNTYLVVNAAAEHPEEIKELLAYLLGYDNQFYRSYISVRKDVIRDSVEYSESDQKYWLKVSSQGDVYMELDIKPDGTSWLEEYMTFIETCEPTPGWRYTPVGMILSEELPPYFTGDKSAQEVAGIIQSRVQVYLNES